MSVAVQRAWDELAGGRPEKAAEILRRHLGVRPRDADAVLALARAQLAMGEPGLSAASAERAGGLLPGRPEPRAVLGAALLAGGDDVGGDRAFESAVALAPGDVATWRAWGEALVRAFRQHDAVGVLRRGIDAAGDDKPLLLSYCYALNVAGGIDPAEERSWHERLARAWCAGVVESPRAGFGNAREPGRAIRIAFLSADFREHSCGYFLEGPISGVDPAYARVYLYSTTREPDAFTERFRGIGEWRECAGLSSEQLAALVRRDAIDVLIDCNGWTAPSHMPALAARLAPVQLTYLGYPHTTGLGAIDGRLVDAHTDPAGSERACSERVVRLPRCFVCFRPEPGWPAPAPTPWQRGEAAGPTFGSFNNPAKIAPGVVGAWAGVLARVPGSTLVLKAAGLRGVAGEVLKSRLARAGADPARVRFAPFSPTTHDHVASYAGVDVALDPFPYHGTTTTCEALWMGVPVVTLEGDRHRSRVGVSLLRAAGGESWIAGDEAAYVEIAARLGSDREALRRARTDLRGRMDSGPLRDERAAARGLVDAAREVWRGWCATEGR